MGLESSDVVRFDLGPLIQGQTRIAKLKMLITRLLWVLQVCTVKPTQEIMGWETSNVFRFDLGLLLQGQTRIAKLKNAYNSLIMGPRGLQCETNS